MNCLRHREAAVSSAEFVALVGAVVVLGLGLATNLAHSSGDVSADVARTLQSAVRGERVLRRGSAGQSRLVRVPKLTTSASRVANGPSLRRFEGSASGSDRGQRFSWRATGSACAGCADATMTWSLDDGERTSASRAARAGAARGFSDGLSGAVEASAYAALAATEGSLAATWKQGPLSARAAADAAALIGVEARGKAAVRIERRRQHLEAEGRAVAGAVVRARARAGAHVMSIGIDQALGAEAWAGVGVAGRAHLSHASGRFRVRFTAGAALGLGGQIDAETTIDLRRASNAMHAATGAITNVVRFAW